MSRKAFLEHKANAHRRGIQFLFTYEDWVNWWIHHLGKEWQQKRGCSKGKFCMARLGDTGAYKPDNVKCILTSDNVSDAKTNNTIAFGVRAGHAVLTEDIVKEIFLSPESMRSLTQKFNITIATINDIRSRRTWRRVTDALNRSDLRGRNQWA